MENDRLKKLEKEVERLGREITSLRNDAITVNGTVDATTVPVNLRGIKRKITHAAP